MTLKSVDLTGDIFRIASVPTQNKSAFILLGPFKKHSEVHKYDYLTLFCCYFLCKIEVNNGNQNQKLKQNNSVKEQTPQEQQVRERIHSVIPVVPSPEFESLLFSNGTSDIRVVWMTGDSVRNHGNHSNQGILEIPYPIT
jgi:hypothetical protein